MRFTVRVCGHASRLFEETEGIDIDPPSAVAFATLLKAARCGPTPARPAPQLDKREILLDRTLDRVVSLFS